MGINIAIFSTTGAYSGIGFAVPSNIIRKIVSSLIGTDSYQHPWLGVFGNDITPYIAEALGLSLSQGRGSPVMDDEGSLLVMLMLDFVAATWSSSILTDE